MAKAILEFNLDDSDDFQAHTRAVKSLYMALVLWEFGYNTKKSILSQIERENLSAEDATEKIYEVFWEQMNEKGIVLDDLIN